MAHTLQVHFEKVVDWFAMQLGDEEKKRLVTIYHLPRKYYEEYPIIVFQGLKMTGVFGYDNPEGLLDIAELLDRKDLFESTKPKLQELKKQKGLRKTSTVVDLNMLYSAVDIGPAFEIAMKQIDVAQASSELLQRICKYRFREEQEKKSILCDRLREVKKRLNEASDLLTLMGEEAVGAEGSSYHPATISHTTERILSHQHRLHTPPEHNKDNDCTHIYEVVNASAVKKDTRVPLIPKVKITTAAQPCCSYDHNTPPRTLPKPQTTVNRHQQQQQIHVKLDQEGYALPSKVNTLPVRQYSSQTVSILNENSGSGDSGIGDWPLLKGEMMKGSPCQQLIDKDKTANENSRSTHPPTPPPKPRNNKKGI